MIRIPFILMIVTVLFAVACEPVRADGGQVRTVQRHGDKEITVFTSPSPMCAGWADFSVAVQNIATGEVCEDVQVLVELKHRGPTVPVIRAPATAQAATNKLLKAAFVEVPEQGTWDVTVYVSAGSSPKPSETKFTMQVAAPWPTWMTEWPWFCWPIVPILLFIVHRRLVAARPSGRRINKRSSEACATTRIATSYYAARAK
jgi:hypothetical protein